MNINVITVIKSIFISLLVSKSIHYANSQTTLYTIEFSNDTIINNILNYDKNEVKGISPNCSEAFEVFSEKVINLTQCTLLNARPVRICMNCEGGMNATKETYAALLEESSCKQQYFESDQLGIINIIYDQILSLWTSSHCQNCYNHIKEAAEFFATSREFDNCMKQYNESKAEINSTCVMCLEHFINMNDIYKNFVLNVTEDEESGICMDIVDQMNITRHVWNNMRCLRFDSNVGFPIIITAVLVGIIPVLFYLLSKNVSIAEDIKLVRPKRKSYASLQDSLSKD